MRGLLIIALLLPYNIYGDSSIENLVDRKVEISMEAPMPINPIKPIGAAFKIILKAYKQSGKLLMEIPYEKLPVLTKSLEQYAKKENSVFFIQALGYALLDEMHILGIKTSASFDTSLTGYRVKQIFERLGYDIIETRQNVENLCFIVRNGPNYKKAISRIKENSTITLDELASQMRIKRVIERKSKKIKLPVTKIKIPEKIKVVAVEKPPVEKLDFDFNGVKLNGLNGTNGLGKASRMAPSKNGNKPNNFGAYFLSNGLDVSKKNNTTVELIPETNGINKLGKNFNGNVFTYDKMGSKQNKYNSIIVKPKNPEYGTKLEAIFADTFEELQEKIKKYQISPFFKIKKVLFNGQKYSNNSISDLIRKPKVNGYNGLGKAPKLEKMTPGRNAPNKPNNFGAVFLSEGLDTVALKSKKPVRNFKTTVVKDEKILEKINEHLTIYPSNAYKLEQVDLESYKNVIKKDLVSYVKFKKLGDVENMYVVHSSDNNAFLFLEVDKKFIKVGEFLGGKENNRLYGYLTIEKAYKKLKLSSLLFDSILKENNPESFISFPIKTNGEVIIKKLKELFGQEYIFGLKNLVDENKSLYTIGNKGRIIIDVKKHRGTEFVKLMTEIMSKNTFHNTFMRNGYEIAEIQIRGEFSYDKMLLCSIYKKIEPQKTGGFGKAPKVFPNRHGEDLTGTTQFLSEGLDAQFLKREQLWEDFDTKFNEFKKHADIFLASFWKIKIPMSSKPLVSDLAYKTSSAKQIDHLSSKMDYYYKLNTELEKLILEIEKFTPNSPKLSKRKKYLEKAIGRLRGYLYLYYKELDEKTTQNVFNMELEKRASEINPNRNSFDKEIFIPEKTKIKNKKNLPKVKTNKKAISLEFNINPDGQTKETIQKTIKKNTKINTFLYKEFNVVFLETDLTKILEESNGDIDYLFVQMFSEMYPRDIDFYKAIKEKYPNIKIFIYADDNHFTDKALQGLYNSGFDGIIDMYTKDDTYLLPFEIPLYNDLLKSGKIKTPIKAKDVDINNPKDVYGFLKEDGNKLITVEGTEEALPKDLIPKHFTLNKAYNPDLNTYKLLGEGGEGYLYRVIPKNGDSPFIIKIFKFKKYAKLSQKMFTYFSRLFEKNNIKTIAIPHIIKRDKNVLFMNDIRGISIYKVARHQNRFLYSPANKDLRLLIRKALKEVKDILPNAYFLNEISPDMSYNFAGKTYHIKMDNIVIITEGSNKGQLVFIDPS